MTDAQLCIAIGVPILLNGLMFTACFVQINRRFNRIDQRLDELHALCQEGIRSLEAIIERLKRLEERR